MFELKLTSVDKASREQIVSRDLTLVYVAGSRGIRSFVSWESHVFDVAWLVPRRRLEFLHRRSGQKHAVLIGSDQAKCRRTQECRHDVEREKYVEKDAALL